MAQTLRQLWLSVPAHALSFAAQIITSRKADLGEAQVDLLSTVLELIGALAAIVTIAGGFAAAVDFLLPHRDATVGQRSAQGAQHTSYAATGSASHRRGARPTATAQTATQATDRSRRRKIWIVSSVVLALLVTLGSALWWQGAQPRPVTRPGGLWIAPTAGEVVGPTMHFAARAYPSHPGDPKIDHVNFTVWWPELYSSWKVACEAGVAASGDVFSCSANLRQLGAPGGAIKASFDVVDAGGNVNYSPNGEHSVEYEPRGP